SDVNGFRCIRSIGPIPEALLAPVELTSDNHAAVAPVSEEIFRAYRAMFSYDRAPLNSAIESAEESPQWRKEKITFSAAYGGERGGAQPGTRCDCAMVKWSGPID